MIDKKQRIEIGNRLEACRKRIGIRTEEMAICLDIPYADYIGMETGDESKNLDVIWKLE